MGEKYLAKWNEKFFAQIHGLPGFPLKSFVSCQASNGLPFVRRPWKTVRLGYLYSNSISKHFHKTFHRFPKARKILEKISRKVKLENFAQIHGLPGFPLKSFVSWRASNGVPFVRRPSDLDICAVTQYLTIFGKHFIGFRKREKYGRKVSRKVKLKVFSSNPRSSGLPIEILCFMRGS